jgi:predicted nucleic acid-binding Zn ribbon protein
MSEAPLAQCPKCGNAVRRVLSAPSVISGQAHLLKESNAAKNGFTQYRRAGGGVYEKTAGKGPKFISGD